MRTRRIRKAFLANFLGNNFLKNKGLLKVLKEQFVFGFTGRVNVLLGHNDQYLGAIYQKDGKVIHSEYESLKGKKALYKILFDDIDDDVSLKFLIEPEIISENIQTFEYTFDSLYEKVRERYPLYSKTKKLKPSSDIKLGVSSAFVIRGEKILPEEFDVLCNIVSSPKVGDVYLNSLLYDYEITNYLVSLRKKQALKVLGPVMNEV